LSPKDSFDLTQTGYMTAAAYCLAQREASEKITLALILDQEGSFWSHLENDMIGQVVPIKAMCK
ncbi:hypothetical protein Micbo1qcDRAFT_129121, partial [Microdochium bolleyi]